MIGGDQHHPRQLAMLLRSADGFGNDRQSQPGAKLVVGRQDAFGPFPFAQLFQVGQLLTIQVTTANVADQQVHRVPSKIR